MSAELPVLIVGGYGTFGGRLVDLLEDEPRLTLLVGGRSITAAREYCDVRRSSKAKLLPVQFDRDAADEKSLESLNLSILVDASGPFQSYGNRPYHLIELCIRCRVNYLDLADGSDFVRGVSAYQDAAQAAGVFILSGVSSFPVLTAAVVRSLANDMASIHTIRGGVAPSPYAGVGLNVIRAIASYAGHAVALKRAANWTRAFPFTESRHFVIAVPGQIPLLNRRFSLVEVPDLRALADLWPESEEVWMGAAPVPAPSHRMLTGFAWLVRLKILPSLKWLARPMHSVTNYLRWGEHRGGMFVTVSGVRSNGDRVTSEWHLLAEGNDGPLIPSMAAEAVIRRALDGNPAPPGARSAIGDVTLADYDGLFARHQISTGVRLQNSTSPYLFERVLGSAWNRLAPEIRQLHSVTGHCIYRGDCTVEAGDNAIARMIARVIGFPSAGGNKDMRVDLSSRGNSECWVRSCAGRSFSSILTAERGRSQGLVRERFGPVSVDMALLLDGENLRYVIRRWALFGCPLPKLLGPRTDAFESSRDGKFQFDVSISLPLLGRIVRYQGALSPALS